MGPERGPVHQRRAHHRLGAAQAPRRTLAHRHRGRRRVPHRHRGRAMAWRARAERSPQAHAQLRRASSWSPAPCCSPSCGCSSCATSPTSWAWLPVPPAPTSSRVRSEAASAGVPAAVFGLLGGWLLAGRMLAPLTRITDATRMAATGSLTHRIQLEGRRDEFRELADAFDRCSRGSKRRSPSRALRRQCLPRAAHPAGDHADPARRGPQRQSRDHDELVERLHRQHPGDRPHRGVAPAQPRRPADLRPRTRRPVADRRGGHRDAPPARRAAPPSRPPATPRPRSAHPRCCCRW